MTERERINRLRAQVLVLIAVVVFGAVFFPLAFGYWVQSRVDSAQFDITCTSVQANADQLAALRSIARELGIPAPFEIPEIPPECE